MSNIVDTFIAPPCDDAIEVLYEDAQLLLINKPSGLLSLSGKNPLNQDSVHYRLRKIYPGITLVHRLDFGTSGIMVLALDKTSNAQLSKQFQQGTVVKRYQAILNGHLANDYGTIDAPIAKDPANFPRVKICYDNGKPALSRYQVQAHNDNPATSRVCFTPATGRTHQLRLHSQLIGHPILGCDLYGTADTKAMAGRLLLHAEALEFDHPLTGVRVKGWCECPFP